MTLDLVYLAQDKTAAGAAAHGGKFIYKYLLPLMQMHEPGEAWMYPQP